MATTLTPLGRTPLPLATLKEPTYTLAEQGGFRDATITASYADALNMRLAEVNIDERYLGDVRSAIGQTLTVQGKQTALDTILHGRVYTTATLEAWSETQYATRNTDFDCANTNAGTMVWTLREGTLYPSGAYNGKFFSLPETQSVVLTFAHGIVSAGYTLEVRSGPDAAVTHAYTNIAAGTKTLTLAAGLSVGIYLRRTGAAITPPADVTFALSSVSITHTAGASFAAVINDICDMAGALVPLRDIDPSITHTFEELTFSADTSLLSMLSTIIAHGDWYARFEARVDGGKVKPCLRVGPRPTVPAYALEHDGTTVIADIAALSCDPLASVVRCRYVNSWGVPLFYDVADEDPEHYLVATGVRKMVSLDTGQTNVTATVSIGLRYLVDAGRDQYQGTLTLIGSPGGRNANDYLPGELIMLSTPTHGTITTRITEGTYTGAHMATLTLDSSPDLAARLARWQENPLSPITAVRLQQWTAKR